MSSLPWPDVLNRLNLNHLLGFMAVAETGSFRAAAGCMHISQSALSVQVRLLEEGLASRYSTALRGSSASPPKACGCWPWRGA